MGRNFDEISWASLCFICCAERPTKMSPQIPPNLLLHVLSRLLWLKSQNFIFASFWGLGPPKQKHAHERKRKSANERKCKSAKEHKGSMPHKKLHTTSFETTRFGNSQLAFNMFRCSGKENNMNIVFFFFFFFSGWICSQTFGPILLG